ncbi:SRPBCC domain-containing protein [bacterium]|nr:SRPBCC domain-containing protein [bacterium]
MARVKYTIEYPMKTSTKVLFNRLSTAGGLSEWFADDVYVSGNHFTFVWDGAEQVAEIVTKKDQKFVKYKWLDEDDEEYFEFKINVDELTGDVALIITDFTDEDELDDDRDLWDSQIARLKHILGS